jgi:Asp-tRNA(Asn)/Glu-tRNA(Gln) amidotransferase A subunit family amidase
LRALALMVVAAGSLLLAAAAAPGAIATAPAFRIEEATIVQVQAALLTKRVTSVWLVRQYLQRIKAYNGQCVRQPQGVLGPAMTIANAGQINALATLNLRPAARQAWGFDERKARSMTDASDVDPKLPDALEIAAAQDAQFARTGKLAGPLHGVVMAVKDQYDTADMRTTSGADAPYANDRPPRDATFVTRLREAGAIIIGKANMGEYAGGDRSSYGGVFCNPYDTERSPGRSSGGSASSVAANLALCAIGEESGPSIRNPSRNNNVIGLAPTQELVSRAGMIKASFLNDRVGPICRTVADTARVLDVIAGYDPRDELTAFAVGRTPLQPYASYAAARSLVGMRIGVLREYMDKAAFAKADEQTIDIIERELPTLAKLGATLVDPGAGGALFGGCVQRLAPALLGADGAKVASLRDIGERSTGEGRFVLDEYLRERGDANIRSTADLIAKSTFYTDVHEKSGFTDKRRTLQQKEADQTLELARRLQLRFALQQIVMQCMGEQQLDALVYPTGNVPAPKLGAPTEPNLNGRSPLAWTLLGANGFPAITVPAGFTTEVYDRVEDAAAPGGTRLVGPVPARLPVGIDFLGRPFDEPTLLRIAAAYEAATHHRREAPGFGVLRVGETTARASESVQGDGGAPGSLERNLRKVKQL